MKAYFTDYARIKKLIIDKIFRYGLATEGCSVLEQYCLLFKQHHWDLMYEMVGSTMPN